MGKISKCLLTLGGASKFRLSIFQGNCANFYSSKTNLPTSVYNHSFLNGTNACYMEQLYEEWLENSQTVHPSIEAYFRNLDNSGSSNVSTVDHQGVEYNLDARTVEAYFALQMIIKGYQARGYLYAKTDPLETAVDGNSTSIAKLKGNIENICHHVKLENISHDTVLKLPPWTYIGGSDSHLPLKEVIDRLEKIYCGHIGIQYMHIQDVQQRMWIRNKFETPNSFTATKEEKIALINSLGEASWFENFLRKRFPSIKRFGIEGCEVIIPCLNIVIDKSSEIGADTFIIGATHRGRVNILANVCQAPLDLVISQFMDHPVKGWETGDVKYHLGTYRERMTTNKKIRVSLLGNPSHLEVVFPLTQGRAKAEQVFRPDAESQKVLPIVIHGDAAICGQGVSWETTNLANLPCYNTGGTVHVIINNRLGFTTEPWQYKSSMESTDLCSVIGAPIFHVNADDPESVLHVSKIAAEWRATFQKDVILDVVGYRRFGHSEEDEPSFTQPLQYSVIKKKKTNFELYAQKLLEKGTITKESLTDMEQKFEHRCAEAFEKAKQKKFHTVEEWTENPKFVTESGVKEGQTGISQEVLEHIATRFSSPPPDSHNFQMHRGLKRILSARMDLVKQKKCDWAMGEALAIGSLLRDGVHVRLTGQDVERGTFSHRHHVLFHEILRNVTHQYLTDLYPDQARYTICNTPLSECGVLGFELGYSSTSANCLVIWEAQFGDFANTAQVIFDTMITSGESKWGRKTGLVCFLPHGMEGPSPEHSSARPERFLQMGSDDPDYLPPNSNNFAVEQLRKINWIVANCTTTANFFHILRRQIALPFRKPLILLTPKSLLRLPATRSDFKDMIEGTEFQRIISDDGPASKNPTKVANILFCSGKIFYEVKDILSKRKCEDKLPLIRIEQVCPFPYDLVKKECEKYQKAKIVWVQEEHKNGGCWSYVQPRFETVTKGERDIIYIGRQPSASTATGYNAKYLEELRKLLDDVTNLCS